MTDQQPLYAPGDVLVDRYTVERVLGRGAFGEVLQVVDRETERQYALKYVPPQIARDTAQMQAIRTNFRLVSELTHPHIAAVRHLLTDPLTGQVFVLMDLVRGQTLTQWMKACRDAAGDPQAPLALPVVVGIAEQLAAALDYAHTQPAGFHSDGSIARYGILHRDVKPDNVMIDSGRWYRAGVPFAKVVDFGLAAEIQASLQSMTQMSVDLNQVAGSPAYMSPEQWTGRRLTRGIDQWALAVMIYEMAEGRLPFHGVTFADLRDQVLRGDYQAPEYLSTPQWEALRISFNTDRSHRHPSCLALVKAVANAELSTRNSVSAADIAIPHEAAAAAPYSPGYQECGGGEVAVMASAPAAQVAVGTLRPPWSEGMPHETVSHVDCAVETHEHLNLAPNRLTTRPFKNLRAKRHAAIIALASFMVAVAALVAWRQPPTVEDNKTAVGSDLNVKAIQATEIAQRASAISPHTSANNTHDISIATEDDSAATPAVAEPDPEDPPTMASPEPPVVSRPVALQAAEPCLIAPGEEAVIQVKGMDPSEPPSLLRFAIVGEAPAGAAIDEMSGQLRWRTSPATPSGAYTISIEAHSENPAVGTATQQATILVKAPLLDLSEAELCVDGGGIRQMLATALSVDGSRAVVGSDDGTARLWDTSTGTELRRFIGHSGAVNSVALSGDETRVLTASDDGTVRLWDAQSGKELQRLLGHSGTVNSVAFSSDGTRALSGGDDKTARLWDTTSGKELHCLSGHAGSVNAAALSSDGTTAVTGGSDGIAIVWDTNGGKERQRLLGHAKAVTAVAISADGTTALSGSEDTTARTWDTASGAQLQRFEGHSGSVNAAALSADGAKILTAGYDNVARLWDTSSGKELHRFSGHAKGITSVAFSGDGARAVTASVDGTARLWDVSTAGELGRLENHNYRASCIALAGDGTRLLVGGDDGSAGLWVARSGKFQRIKGHFGAIRAVALSADGRTGLTASLDNTARLWDLASGREIQRFEGHTSAVIAAAISPDGKRAVTGSDDASARFWDSQSGREIQRFVGHTKSVNSVAFSPNGTRVITASDDNSARLWDTASGRELKRFMGHSDAVLSVAFSTNGLVAVTAGADSTARLWDTISGKELVRFVGHSNWVRSVALSEDGTRLFTASDDKTARLWDTSNGKELQRHSGHTGSIYFAAFLPGKRRLLTAGYDQTVRVWNSESGAEVCRLIMLEDGTSVVVAPDRRYDMSPNGDGAHLYWWHHGRRIAFDEMKDRYHAPGLAKQLLDFAK